jgi:hypothetical protein
MKVDAKKTMDAKKPTPQQIMTTLLLPTALHQQARLYAVRNHTSLRALLIEGLKLRLTAGPAEVDQSE